MTDDLVKNYTLNQRRQREALFDCRNLDAIKEWLDQHVVGAPVVTSDFRQKTVDQRKDGLRARALETYGQTLAQGFADSDGTRWAATAQGRDRVLELTQRIQEHRAGKMANALPNGKSTVKLRDVDGTPHELTPDDVVKLAELGSDFKDKAEDRLEELSAQINAATTHADLDAIDVTAGWPS
jgi:hypothetical protein